MTSASIEPSTLRRTAIITGANVGLGYACARALLEDASGPSPWNVVLACRDPVRAQEAVERLRQAAQAAGSAARVEAMRLDLASLRSVREFANEVGQRLDAGDLPPVHALVCNAGVQSGGKQTFTADGFESTFGVNHLGHFLLVNLLLPRLAAPARVVVVSSGTHDPAKKTGVPAPAWTAPMALAKGELGPLAAEDAPRKRGQRSYATSKLANVLFSYELARRLPAGVTVNAFDPGLMPGTGLVRDGSAPLRFLWHQVLPRILPLLRNLISPNIHTPAESGAALARLVVDPALEGASGKYFEGIREIPSSVESYDSARGKELWQASAALTGLDAAPA
jgi:NAD(P)-dependent dehydrogenase (short-subunit alcohol dehydrogenase family)